MSEYIPFLSRVFLQAGILERPICAVVRKGKERFVCEARLAERMAQVRTKTNISRRQAASLRILEKTYDLDEALGLSGFDRRHVTGLSYYSGQYYKSIQTVELYFCFCVIILCKNKVAL